MGEFVTSFPNGELRKQIALRGLTQAAFAELAGIDPETLIRAIHGRRLHTKTFGKIVVALGAIPELVAKELSA